MVYDDPGVRGMDGWMRMDEDGWMDVAWMGWWMCYVYMRTYDETESTQKLKLKVHRN